jgi:hypothetical protein
VRTVFHRENLEHCPFLPLPEHPMTAAVMKRHGEDRGPDFYLGALTCAQSLWLQGLPAQAILQLDRALAADLSAEADILSVHPLPYAPMAWLLRHRRPDQFIGNPRRHFQHLATRLTGPRAEVRCWRAWACWWMSRIIDPTLPADEEQLAQESITEPTLTEIESSLNRFGHAGEVALWRRVISELRTK